MPHQQITSRFHATLYRPELDQDSDSWSFLLLPQEVSDTLPRRGRTTVDGLIQGHPFQATLEPDGRLGHWLRVEHALQEQAKIAIGDWVHLEISPVAEEPEPLVPNDLATALAAAPESYRTWESTTAVARLDWIHWIVSAKHAKTRAKRIVDACDMLAQGKKRVCCFDSSGYYSKAFCAPTPAPQK
jgi:hypothetical protein